MRVSLGRRMGAVHFLVTPIDVAPAITVPAPEGQLLTELSVAAVGIGVADGPLEGVVGAVGLPRLRPASPLSKPIGCEHDRRRDDPRLH